MKTIEIHLYTIQELKEQFPDAYKKAYQRHVETCCEYETPWQREIFQSLEALVKACGLKMSRWDLGDSSNRSQDITLSGSDDVLDLSGPRAKAWFYNRILKPNGYVRPTFPGWKVEFPGVCPFTGYCADEDFIEAAWENLVSGDTIKDALESLASVYAKLIDSEIEGEQSEDRFIETCDSCEWEFTQEGRKY